MNMSNNNYGPAFLQSETCSTTYMKDKNYKKIYTYDKSCSFDVKEQLEVINGVPCLKSSLYNFETCSDKNPYTESKDTCKESLYYYHYQRANNWYPYVDFSETGCEKILQENGASECHFLGKYSLLDSKIPSENPPSENPPSENPSAGNTITDSTINIKNEENGAEYDEECGLLGDPSNEESLAHYINLLIEIIKYIGIILCVVLTIVDFAKGLFSEEKELPQNLSKKLWTRLILAISLFFLPMLIKPLLFFLGVYGNCVIK